MNTENEKLVIHSGKTVPHASGNGAPKSYLTRSELRTIHLMPTADPVCYTKNDDGSIKFYFSPDNVTVTPAEIWYSDSAENHETLYKLPDGSLIPLIGKDDAESLGLFTAEHLNTLHLTIIEPPCAFCVSHEDDKLIDDYYNDKLNSTEQPEARENSDIFPDKEGEKIFLYDIRTCKRNPLMCTRCGKGERFKNKLCRRCYEKDMLIRRRAGDAYRASVTGVDRGRAIFFDLELTGVYPYDEIISVSITDGYGNEIMDTLVRPEKRKQWNTTVKIHGITPAMVKNAPYLSELTPKIKAILLNAEIIVAYGISTDYAHIKKIFTEDEQKILEKKLRCCAREYVRYILEYEPDINRSALVSAMEYFKIDWTGSAHTSMADTHACRFVWEKIFPACYTDSEADGIGKKTQIMQILEDMPKTRSLTFEEGAMLAKAESEKASKNASDAKSQSCKKTCNSCKKGKNAQVTDQKEKQEKPEVPAKGKANGTQKCDKKLAKDDRTKENATHAKPEASKQSGSDKKKGGFFAAFFKPSKR